jgi:hypothetical protein
MQARENALQDLPDCLVRRVRGLDRAVSVLPGSSAIRVSHSGVSRRSTQVASEALERPLEIR